MLPFIARRLAWAVVLFFAVTAITFVIFHVIPEDPAFLIMGPQAALDPAGAKVVRHKLGVDRPLSVQYADYVWKLVRHGSFGTTYESIRAGKVQHVRDMISEALPTTASLVLGGAVLWLLIAIPVGLLSALRPRSMLDRLTLGFVLLGISVHPIVVGTTFQYLFGHRLRIAPDSGYCPLTGHGGALGCGGPLDWASHLILPWLSFALLFVALYSRMVRASVLEVLTEQYVRVARAKGMSERRLLVRHVLRNALLPLVTMLGMDLGLAIGNSIYIEKVFKLQGMGYMVYQALIGVEGYELPVIAGVVLVASLAVIAFNLVIDVAYAFVDPRIRTAD